MTEPRIARLTRIEQAARSAEPDILRDALRWATEELMEADVTAQLGAAPHVRTAERTRYRNGCRTRAFDTRMGALELAIPTTDRTDELSSVLKTSGTTVGEKSWTYRGLLDVSPAGLATPAPLLEMGSRFYTPSTGTFTRCGQSGRGRRSAQP